MGTSLLDSTEYDYLTTTNNCKIGRMLLGKFCLPIFKRNILPKTKAILLVPFLFFDSASSLSGSLQPIMLKEFLLNRFLPGCWAQFLLDDYCVVTCEISKSSTNVSLHPRPQFPRVSLFYSVLEITADISAYATRVIIN